MVVLYLLGTIWALPNTLLGLCLLPFYGYRGSGGNRDWCKIIYVKRAIGNPGAQTWGNVIYVVDEYLTEDLFAHEKTHTRQGMRFGVFFLLAYAIEFFVRYLMKPSAGWRYAYWNLSWEVAARKEESKNRAAKQT